MRGIGIKPCQTIFYPLSYKIIVGRSRGAVPHRAVSYGTSAARRRRGPWERIVGGADDLGINSPNASDATAVDSRLLQVRTVPTDRRLAAGTAVINTLGPPAIRMFRGADRG